MSEKKLHELLNLRGIALGIPIFQEYLCDESESFNNQNTDTVVLEMSEHAYFETMKVLSRKCDFFKIDFEGKYGTMWKDYLLSDSFDQEMCDLAQNLSEEQIAKVDSNGRSLLLKAAYQGNVRLVRIIINQIGKLPISNEWRTYAITYAIKNGYHDVAQELIRQGRYVVRSDKN